MEKRGILTKILAFSGTALVWLSVLAPVLFSMLVFIRSDRFHFDFLMPAELFPVALIGGGLLVWAALEARSRLKLIGLGIIVAFGLLVGSQALAIITGLASGETEAAGLWWGLVVAGIVGYDLAVIAMGVGGVLLLRDLYTAPDPSLVSH